MDEQVFGDLDRAALAVATARVDAALSIDPSGDGALESVTRLIEAARALLVHARGEDLRIEPPPTAGDATVAPSELWARQARTALAACVTTLDAILGRSPVHAGTRVPDRFRAAARAAAMLRASRDHLAKYAHRDAAPGAVAEDLFRIRAMGMRIAAWQDLGAASRARAECHVVFSTYRDLVRVFPDPDLRREYLAITVIYCELLVAQGRRDPAIDLLTLVAHRAESAPALTDLGDVAVRMQIELTDPGAREPVGNEHTEDWEYLFTPEVLADSQGIGIVHSPGALYTGDDTDGEASEVLEELIRTGIVDAGQDEPIPY